jgi:poly-D-alanine transfer protein DltD
MQINLAPEQFDRSESSTESLANADAVVDSSPMLQDLQQAVAQLAAAGHDVDFIMRSTWHACVDQMPALRQRLQEQEHSQFVEQIDDLRRRGRLALA